MAVQDLAGEVEVLNCGPLLAVLEVIEDEREQLDWKGGERGRRRGGRGALRLLLD